MNQTISNAPRNPSRSRARGNTSVPDGRSAVKAGNRPRTVGPLDFYDRQARTNAVVRAIPGMRNFGVR